MGHISLNSPWDTLQTYKRKVKQNNAYQDFEDYHNMSQEVPQDYDACYFTQNVQPPNWDPNKFGAFQPCTVLQIRDLPSRMHSQRTGTVVLRYCIQGGQSKFNFLFPQLNNILDWYCGPSNDRYCPCGAREVGCCGHVATALVMGCTLAHNPATFKSTHRPFSIMDIHNPPLGHAKRLNVELQRGVTM